MKTLAIVSCSFVTLLLLDGRSKSVCSFSVSLRTIVDVYAMDHRGQGLSGRIRDRDGNLVTGNQYMSHVDDFDDFVNDVHHFVTRIIPCKGSMNATSLVIDDEDAAESLKVTVVAHSMGALVSTVFASKHPELVSRLIFSAPGFEPILPAPQRLVLGVCKLACALGQQYKGIPGQYSPPHGIVYDTNTLSHSRPLSDLWSDLKENSAEEYYVSGATAARSVSLRSRFHSPYASISLALACRSSMSLTLSHTLCRHLQGEPSVFFVLL